MKDLTPRYTLRISQMLLYKLEVIAEYNSRSKNKEIEMLIRKHIEAFEAEHSEITIPTTKQD